MKLFAPVSVKALANTSLQKTSVFALTDDEKSSIQDALRLLAEKFKEKVVGVLAAVQGRTAKGLA